VARLFEARTPTGERLKPPEGKVIYRLLAFGAERGIEAEVDPLTEVAPPVHEAATYASTAVALESAPAAPLATAPGVAPAAAAITPSWRSVGPTVMHNGQTYGSGRVDVAGRVGAIAVDPTNRNHVLVGSAGGGVWETLNGGTSWAPRTDTMPTLTVGALAFDPSAPSTVYCGTGEGNFYAALGAGLLRSTNGGTTWSLLTSNPFVGVGFYDLIVDPGDHTRLVAGTTAGLYVSTTSGTSWTQARAVRTWGLAVHPNGGAGAEWLAASSDGLHRSVNGGQSWTAVTLPGAPGNWSRLDVAICRSNPAVAYAFGASGTSAYLYRRASGGGWQSVSPPPGLSTSQAWYDWYVEAARDRDSQVYLGAIDLYRGDLAAGGSWTWTNLSSKASGDSIHPDQHALTVDPGDPNTVYAGSDGGLYRSSNRGVNWTALNNGLAITEIEYLAQDYGSSRWLFGGTQDNGSVRYTGAAAWDHAADGDGGFCAVPRSNPNTVFHTFFGMGMERSTSKGDFGSWAWLGPSVPNGYQALFYPPVGCFETTIAQAGQSVYISRNGGANWAEVTLPAGVLASALHLPSANRVLAGATNGRLFRIDWNGTAWGSPVELTRPRNSAYISDILVDPGSASRIWVTSSTIGGGRVFRSDNGGSTWTDFTTGLPSLPVNAIEVDPGNTNRVWVAADLGVYQSLDGGAHWAPFNQGLPNALVADLVFHPNARLLRAGTRNRGVWEVAVDGWQPAPVCGTQFTGTVPANGQQRWFTFNWPATWHVVWTVMPTTVRPGGPAVSWTVSVERAGAEFVTYWIAVTNLTPVPIAIEGRYAILG
jgi:hypothetical protein